jgi:hypothetical protein
MTPCQPEKTISDIELILIRHLKRNQSNDGIIRRIVAKYYALFPTYIDKRHIFECMLAILKKHDLLPHHLRGENIHNLFTDAISFEPPFEDPWDSWIYRATVYLRQTEVAKLPRYPEPAWFRNFRKKREEQDRKDLARRVKPAIYVAYYSHENADCYKIDLPFSQYGCETLVLCKVSEGLEKAKDIARKRLHARIEESFSLS